MEGGIENDDVGNVRQHFHEGPDSRQVRRVVERRQFAQFVDLRDDVVIDNHRVGKIVAALDDPVADALDLVKGLDDLPFHQVAKEEIGRLFMVFHRQDGLDLLAVDLDRVVGIVQADAFDKPFRYYLFLRHVVEFEF